MLLVTLCYACRYTPTPSLEVTPLQKLYSTSMHETQQHKTSLNLEQGVHCFFHPLRAGHTHCGFNDLIPGRNILFHSYTYTHTFIPVLHYVIGDTSLYVSVHANTERLAVGIFSVVIRNIKYADLAGRQTNDFC
jgi:hypothetical protein